MSNRIGVSTIYNTVRKQPVSSTWRTSFVLKRFVAIFLTIYIFLNKKYSRYRL